ncbi:MAG: tetratricopeptide repeat protein [Rhodobacteraceae bacterium]|jgi:Flp pilus assembly protein TadD|nr:tetratricopeptide repeat protein [Paracoccaceae bacterium]
MTSALLRLTLAFGLALAAPVAAEEPAAAPPAELLPPPGKADPGAYLAGRSAEAHGDFRAAAAWFAQAAAIDPDNMMIRDGALFANLNLGNVDEAARIAREMRGRGAGGQLVDFALIAADALHEDYGALDKALSSGQAIGPLFDKLALGWARVGEGQMTEALATFDEVAKTRGFESFGLYHKALALALAGDYEGANRIFSGEEAGVIDLSQRGVIANIQVLSQLERNADALALLDRAFGTQPNPVIDALREQLQAGAPLAFDSVNSARDGIAEVFFTIATLLSADADPALTLMNARTAAVLRPDHTQALLMSAGSLEALQQYDLAVEAYGAIKPEDPAFYSAEIGRADALYAAGRKDAAIEALQNLARRHPDLLVVPASLGDMLRREERWTDALAAYDAAIGLVAEPRDQHWSLFFSRGIAEERLGRYDAADADFRKALSLNPGQPQVLNYLGYSLIERRQNLDEALAMINEAVAAEPEAGYIIDSLAWAYFTLGRYEEALAPMEQASLLEPVDPTVTDHLGDVYWMNGRKREAEFQWRRALSFNPAEKDATRIRKKLELGLDAVLGEEDTSPDAVKAAGNGN